LFIPTIDSSGQSTYYSSDDTAPTDVTSATELEEYFPSVEDGAVTLDAEVLEGACFFPPVEGAADSEATNGVETAVPSPVPNPKPAQPKNQRSNVTELKVSDLC